MGGSIVVIKKLVVETTMFQQQFQAIYVPEYFPVGELQDVLVVPN